MTDTTPSTPQPGQFADAGDQQAAAPVNLWKYLGWFALSAIGMTLVYALISELLSMDSGSAGFSMLVPFLATMFAVDRFVKDHDRVLERREMWWLTLTSFAVTLIWSGVALLVMLAAGMFDGLGDQAGLLLVALAIGVAISFLLVWAGYAWWPKRTLANYRKRAARGR